jgi:dihydroneopterin aldolase
VTDIIFIEGLKTQAIIGIYDWEREARQPLIFDIELGMPDHFFTHAAQSDAIGDTVDYKQVSDEVIALVEGSRHELLETLVEEVCAHIFKHHAAVQSIRLKISKPQAVAETDTVGLMVRRQRAS